MLPEFDKTIHVRADWKLKPDLQKFQCVIVSSVSISASVYVSVWFFVDNLMLPIGWGADLQVEGVKIKADLFSAMHKKFNLQRVLGPTNKRKNHSYIFCSDIF